jgi:hypothetical protein
MIQSPGVAKLTLHCSRVCSFPEVREPETDVDLLERVLMYMTSIGQSSYINPVD